MPQFATPLARQQATLMMQPALIRVIDNIRKQLDNSDWRGTYQEDFLWPEGTDERQQQDYFALQKQLSTASPEAYDRVQAQLQQLPQPMPVYTLCLEKPGEKQRRIDLWELCYRICAQNYDPDSSSESRLEIDQTLLDSETGALDWNQLDQKARRLVTEVFADLS
ncbi:hypothetical protein IQ241_04415 [Romeria aff. gracilis LEGE 07310]|uniref:Uncharacterized protein n=1 Tax=Vasconcelosia minhoensis LEGE 07310 TaxID=915328 RepID=A0A8J7ABE8_9CYAN|nr:hypothetical protein [Romeria aff. gracilis LEGE 07310]